MIMRHIWIIHNESFTNKNECQMVIPDNPCTACGNSLDISSRADNLLFWVGGLLPFVLALLGYIGNLLSIYILSRPRIISTFNRLLIVLAYFDACYIFNYIIEEAMVLIDFSFSDEADFVHHCSFYLHLYVCFLYPFQQIFQASSILMIVIISIDRYVAIIHPLYVDDASNIIRTFLLGPTRRNVVLYILTIVFLSTLVCFPHFLEFTVLEDDHGPYLAFYWRNNFLFCLLYKTIFDFLMRIVLPVFILHKNYQRISSRSGWRCRGADAGLCSVSCSP